MNKITSMYKWSGGTDYTHVCAECGNCIKAERGKRKVFKCIAYGDTSRAATDWRASNIACKHFGKPVPEKPVMMLEQGSRRQQDDGIEGQISMFDNLYTKNVRKNEVSDEKM